MITKTFNAYNIRIRQSDRYVSLTDMAKATGKLVADWQRLKSTESYLETLSSIMGIPIIDLIESNVGNRGFESGTWGHPKVSLRFAQWCSDEFAVQVDCWLDELLTTGKVELKPTPALPPVDIRVVNIEGEPWFVAKDLCDVLELSEVSKSVERLDDDEKGTNTISTLGGNNSASHLCPRPRLRDCRGSFP